VGGGATAQTVEEEHWIAEEGEVIDPGVGGAIVARTYGAIARPLGCISQLFKGGLRDQDAGRWNLQSTGHK
jgi:hypothetical protein